MTLDEVRRWRPRPPVEANLNHRFVTAHGILDVVPRLSGTYDDLLEGSRTVRLGDRDVTVADPAPIVECSDCRNGARIGTDGRRPPVYTSTAISGIVPHPV